MTRASNRGPRSTASKRKSASTCTLSCFSLAFKRADALMRVAPPRLHPAMKTGPGATANISLIRVHSVSGGICLQPKSVQSGPRKYSFLPGNFRKILETKLFSTCHRYASVERGPVPSTQIKMGVAEGIAMANLQRVIQEHG